MKKLIFLIPFFLSIFTAYAQRHNRFFVGLNGGIASPTLNSTDQFYPIVNPKVGYQLGNLITGFELNSFGSFRVVDKSSLEFTNYSKIIAYGIFVRYNTNSRCLPFFESKINIGSYSLNGKKETYRAFVLSPAVHLIKRKNFEANLLIDVAIGKLVNKNFDLYPKAGIGFFL